MFIEKFLKIISIFIAACLITSALSVPLTTFSYIHWLNSIDMPVTLDIILFSLKNDFTYFILILLIISSLSFFFAFISTKAIYSIGKYKIPISYEIAYGVSAALGFYFGIYLTIELLFGTQLIGGFRFIYGQILHLIAGFLGGYFFGTFLRKYNKIYE